MAGRQSEDNSKFATVDAGGTIAPARPDGDGIQPLADEFGRLWVRPVGSPAPFPAFPVPWQHAEMAALVEDSVVLAVPGILSQLSGYVTVPDGSTWYVQLRDSVDGSGDLIEEIPVQGSGSPGTWAFQPGNGWQLAAGLFLSFSTTPDTFTSPGGDVGKYSATGWQA